MSTDLPEADWWHQPVKPLLEFGAALGIEPGVIAQREEPVQLTLEVEIPRERAARLLRTHLRALWATYGSALSCLFLLGDLPVLRLTASTSEADLASFRQQIAASPFVALDLSLDKTSWMQQRLQPPPHVHPFFFLFPDSLLGLLSGGLDHLERTLWNGQGGSRVLLLVAGVDLALNGDFLAARGGRYLSDWEKALRSDPPPAAESRRLYTLARANLAWQEPWLQHLTPLHLRVDRSARSLLDQGRSEPGSGATARAIVNALGVHYLNALILYTADRTDRARSDAGAPSQAESSQAESAQNGPLPDETSAPTTTVGAGLVGTYAGAQQRVSVPLGNPATAADLPDHVDALSKLEALLAWTYSDPWAADRLSLVQVVVAEALHAAPFAARYDLLLHNAAGLLQAAQWHWKALIEGKVDAYGESVRGLEDYVDQTARTYAAEVGDMIKGLSDTMLAAVAVLLGTFVASLLSTPFNALVFWIGALVYAVYVALFPLAYSMGHQMQRFRVLNRQVAARRVRFAQRLDPDRVRTVIDEQVPPAQRRFLIWYWVTVLIYLAVIGGSVWAAATAPDLMAAAGYPLSAPAPTATHTAIPPSTPLSTTSIPFVATATPGP